MLLSPAVLALVGGSALVGGITAAAAVAGLSAASGWNPDDGGTRQLARERRLLLVEVALKVALGCQLLSLFVFVATVDRLHPLFTGAMCAAGTLNASRFGYPALLAKLAVFGLCGLWLVAHRASPAATGTGLVRSKQLLVLAVLAALMAENVLQIGYFSDLDPEILTSCCATIFSAEAGGIGADVAALPVGASRVAFFALLALTLAAGLRFLRRNRNPALYAALAVLLGLVSAAAVVTWVAPGFYQLPTHHCPFCLLSRQHGHVGVPLYLFLAVAVVAGVGVGVVRGLRGLDPRSIRPAEERRLCAASMIGFALFALIAAWPTVASDFRMEGY